MSNFKPAVERLELHIVILLLFLAQKHILEEKEGYKRMTKDTEMNGISIS